MSRGGEGKVTVPVVSLAMVFAAPAMAQDFSDDDVVDDDQVFAPTVSQSTVITRGSGTADGALVFDGVVLTAIND